MLLWLSQPAFLATSAAAEDVLVSMGFTNFYFDAAEDTAVGMIE